MARNFDTKFSRSSNTKNFVSCAGSPKATEYAYKIIEGVKKLVPVGEVDIQAEIDSYAESCDINIIVARFVNGDTGALNQVQGFYADMRQMPKTFAEWHEKYQECENLFAKLPVDVKEKFNNSVSEFWSDFGSDHFIDALSIKVNKTDDLVIEKEVKDNAE